MGTDEIFAPFPEMLLNCAAAFCSLQSAKVLSRMKNKGSVDANIAKVGCVSGVERKKSRQISKQGAPSNSDQMYDRQVTSVITSILNLVQKITQTMSKRKTQGQLPTPATLFGVPRK